MRKSRYNLFSFESILKIDFSFLILIKSIFLKMKLPKNNFKVITNLNCNYCTLDLNIAFDNGLNIMFLPKYHSKHVIIEQNNKSMCLKKNALTQVLSCIMVSETIKHRFKSFETF